MPTNQEPIVPLVSCTGRIEAEMWVEALRRDGIPAMLRSRALGALPTEQMHICVLESDVTSARILLGQLGARPEDFLR